VAEEKVKCPFCRSTNVEADHVDNGVGEERCGPYGCEDCHAVEMRVTDDPKDLLTRDAEIKDRWFRFPKEK